MLRFYDTASERVVELVPRDEGTISMYICGPTVYGAPHIGHGRSTLVYDVLRRYLEWRGYSVRHVSNITDIDDKIIARANAEDRPWQEIATECEVQWWEAMDALGVLRPNVTPRATEYVAQMIELITEMIERGVAYRTSDGVYLETAKVPGYGLLAHQTLESLRAGARVELGEEKRAPSDFALWKSVKPDEPSWPSPFGDGRPGWHTECVAMSLELLGEGFDIHGGGLDLVFPHHENERAQAVSLDRRFARHWVHHGFVLAGTEKMSKSLGNITSLSELLADVDPRSYRMLVLRSKYRSPLEVTDEILADSVSAIERLDALHRRYADHEATTSEESEALRAQFIEYMDDDLDTPSALGMLFEALRRANGLGDRGEEREGAALAQTVEELFGALGLFAADPAEAIDPDILALVAEMDAARAERDFMLADNLRAEIEGHGYRVENTAEGTRVHRVRPDRGSDEAPAG